MNYFVSKNFNLKHNYFMTILTKKKFLKTFIYSCVKFNAIQDETDHLFFFSKRRSTEKRRPSPVELERIYLNQITDIKINCRNRK